jgi:hypothetical protein
MSLRKVNTMRKDRGAIVSQLEVTDSPSGSNWKIEITKNQIFADRWNCSYKFLGMAVKSVYRLLET